jgi:hypothetical protein
MGLFAFCLAVSLSIGAADDLYTKHLLQADGAVCLDGSPGAFYFRPASTGGEQKFYVHFEGGGWCTDLASCASRSQTLLGSSLMYPDRMVPYQDRGYFNTSVAYFSADPAINPQMYNWNSVFLRYCDGQSFAGALQEPVVNGSTKLHFQGSAVLDAMIAQLRATHSLGNATDVVVGGASAGGLAVYLHADRWLEALPKAHVTAMADSGFFLESDADTASTAGSVDLNGAGLTPGKFASSMRAMVAMSNATAGMSRACTAARTHQTSSGSGGQGDASSGDAWRCVFAQEASRHLSTPTFALQSVFDSWQLTNEMAPGQSTNATAVNAYGVRVRRALNESLLAHPRHGAFIDSCEHHCFAWGAIRISGDDQAAAFAAWYERKAASRVWDQGDPFPCVSCCHGGSGSGSSRGAGSTGVWPRPLLLSLKGIRRVSEWVGGGLSE